MGMLSLKPSGTSQTWNSRVNGGRKFSSLPKEERLVPSCRRLCLVGMILDGRQSLSCLINAMYGWALVRIIWNEIRSNHPRGICQTHLRLIGEFSSLFVASLNVTVWVAVSASPESDLMSNALRDLRCRRKILRNLIVIRTRATRDYPAGKALGMASCVPENRGDGHCRNP
jgi:hypothetical protein